MSFLCALLQFPTWAVMSARNSISYPKISSLAASLTSRKTLFSNFVKRSFPLGLRKWNHRGLHILVCIFFPASQQEWDFDLEHIKGYNCLHLALSLVLYWGEIQLWWFQNVSTQMVRTTLAVWGLGYKQSAGLSLRTSTRYHLSNGYGMRHFVAAAIHFTLLLLSFSISLFL